MLRVLVGLIPFLPAAGLTYLGLLRDHDINYYLAQHPPQFWAAAVIVGIIVIGLVLLLARTIASWALAMPLVLFENVSPRRALGESAARGHGSHSLILLSLTIWAVVVVALLSATTGLVQFLGRAVLLEWPVRWPCCCCSFPDWLSPVLGPTLAVGIFNFSMFPPPITHLYLRIGKPQLSTSTIARDALLGPRRFSPRAVAGIAALALLAAVGVGLFAFLANRDQSPR